MRKWPALSMLAAFYVAATASASAAAPRDRDGDRLPDRWERKYQLSTHVRNARRDPDHDGLSNRREHRLRTHPRRRDTDRDGLRDGAEVRRHRTNPRRKDTDRDGLRDRAEIRRHRTNPRRRDTDRDGWNDGVEVRAGTDPLDPRSHPSGNALRPPGGGSGGNVEPPPPGGFPNAASTGVPAGWVPAQTRSTSLTVSTPGAVVQDIRFTNGADILVTADNVTIRRVDMQGGQISNQYGAAPAGCGHNLLVEDTTFQQEPGTFVSSDVPVLGEGSYTARRIEVDGRGEGPRLSDCGTVAIEDSFIRIKGAEWGSPQCDQVHSDGVQAVAGRGATATNNTIVMVNPCGTSPWFVVNPSVNTGHYNIDKLLVSGGGYSFRQQVSASVRGLRIVDRAWYYGPLDEMDCSVIAPWDAKTVNIDANYQVTGVVRDQPCG